MWPRPSAGEGTAGREPDARLRNGETETHYKLRPGHVKRFPVVIGPARATLEDRALLEGAGAHRGEERDPDGEAGEGQRQRRVRPVRCDGEGMVSLTKVRGLMTPWW